MLEERILNSEACFKEILEYVQEEDNERSIDEVGKDVFNKLLELGQQLMEVFIANQDRGYVGKTITVDKEAHFPGMTEDLDFYHVSEYLWEIAHMFLGEGSREADGWVQKKAAQLKAGRVGYVIGGLKQMLTKGKRIRGQGKRDRLKHIMQFACQHSPSQVWETHSD